MSFLIFSVNFSRYVTRLLKHAAHGFNLSEIKISPTGYSELAAYIPKFVRLKRHQ